MCVTMPNLASPTSDNKKEIGLLKKSNYGCNIQCKMSLNDNNLTVTIL